MHCPLSSPISAIFSWRRCDCTNICFNSSLACCQLQLPTARCQLPVTVASLQLQALCCLLLLLLWSGRVHPSRLPVDSSQLYKANIMWLQLIERALDDFGIRYSDFTFEGAAISKIISQNPANIFCCWNQGDSIKTALKLNIQIVEK